MKIDRRALLRYGGAGAAGLALHGQANAVEPSPAASPAPFERANLIAAGQVAAEPEGAQPVAIMPKKAFDAGRIPGSILIDWAEMELADTSESSVAEWTDRMRELMGVRGIRADEPVVVYDEGTLFAARGWWQLAYLGYNAPRVIDGGLPAWAALGERVESGAVKIAPVEAPPLVDVPVRRGLMATMDEVLAALDDPDVVLLDVRSPKEYAAGHVPGAVNLPFADNASERSPHLYRSTDELREMYAAIGVTPDRRAITYCTTGVRGSAGFFSLKLAGFEEVALYVGSWNEWGNDPATPKETV